VQREALAVQEDLDLVLASGFMRSVLPRWMCGAL
jgi:hypothetical protein